MPEIAWTEPYPVKPKGRGNFKSIPVRTAQIEGDAERFHVYQAKGAMRSLPSMWVLFDELTKSQHFLHANGSNHACGTAAGRIREILTKET